MSSLTYSKTESGLEVVIAPNGAAYCTQSSYSRWSNVPRTTVKDRCQNLEILTMANFEGGDDFPSPGQLVRTTIETTSHAQEVVLIPAKVMFRWLAKDNPDLFDEIGDAGATQLLYTMAGYQLKVVESSIAPTEHQLPATYIEALEALVESEKEKERLRVQNELQAAQIDDLEEDVDKYSSLADESFTHSSIVRIAKFNGISETAFKWRVLKAATKVAKLEVKRAPCPRFGEKLLYPHQAWAIAYPTAKLPENPDSAIVLKD